jgi:adenylyltransferase/sulfurtransferase
MSENARELLSGFDVILDGTDNFETRLLINDAALALCTPWVYGAAVGSYGITLTIRPGQTPCLACLLESGEAAGTIGADATCDTAGILNAAASLIASIEAAEALKILAGKPEALHGRLISCDVWTGKFQSIRIARNPDCRACVRREFTYLEGEAQPQITMCGRNSVQIHEHGRTLNLDELSGQLATAATEIRHNDFLLRFSVPPYELTVFADGRAIVKGTQDPTVARSLYARFIGA